MLDVTSSTPFQGFILHTYTHTHTHTRGRAPDLSSCVVLSALLLLVGTCNPLQVCLLVLEPPSPSGGKLKGLMVYTHSSTNDLMVKGVWNPTSLSRSRKNSMKWFVLQSSNYEFRSEREIVLDSLPSPSCSLGICEYIFNKLVSHEFLSQGLHTGNLTWNSTLIN